MVQYRSDALDRTFAALADPTRRALIARLGEESDLSVSELAEPHRISMQAVIKHLDVLAGAGLVTRTKTGRIVRCRLRATPMEEAAHWLQRYERFWSASFDALAAVVENQHAPRSKAKARKTT